MLCGTGSLLLRLIQGCRALLSQLQQFYWQKQQMLNYSTNIPICTRTIEYSLYIHFTPNVMSQNSIQIHDIVFGADTLFYFDLLWIYNTNRIEI